MSAALLRPRFVGVLIAAGLSAACQSGSGSQLIASSAYAGLSRPAAHAIADDLAGKLSQHVGRSAGTIDLQEDATGFAEALGTSLMGLGYAVVTDQQIDGADLIPLAYTVERFESGIMARVSTGEIDLTRIYTVTSEGAAPAGPMSVLTKQGEGR